MVVDNSLDSDLDGILNRIVKSYASVFRSSHTPNFLLVILNQLSLSLANFEFRIGGFTCPTNLKKPSEIAW